MVKTGSYQPSKNTSLFWFTPACCTSPIFCMSKKDQALRMKLHGKICQCCKNVTIIPVMHGTKQIICTQDIASGFEDRARDVVNAECMRMYKSTTLLQLKE